MPRPRSLTETEIAAAALAVIDRDGLDALSMRAVAKQLGTGTMSLYRYVEDRAQLETLVVDLVLGSVDYTLPPRAPWRRQVSILLGRARDAVAAHPAAVPLTLAHRHASEESRRLGETLLGVLAGAGFAGRRRVIAFRCLLGHLYGALQLDNLGPLAGPGTAALAELPADRYPLLAETAAEAVGVPPEEEFRRGLALILAGFPDEPGGPG